MQRKTYLKLRNLFLVPLTWAACVIFAAALAGVEMNWRLWLVIVVSLLVSDFLDAVVEGRPLSGPKRWE